MTVAAFLEDAVHAIADSFDPLREALADIDSFRIFLQELGWELDPTLDGGHFTIITQIFAPEIAILNSLPNASTEELAAAIPALIAALLSTSTVDPSWPAPLNSSAFWSGTATEPSFLQQVLDGALYDIIGERIPVAFGILRFIGVFDEELEPAAPASGGAPARLQYTRRTMDWNSLGPTISNPNTFFTRVYHWGDPNAAFAHDKLLRNISALFEGLPVGSAVIQASDAAYALYFDNVPSSPNPLEQLTVVPFSYQSTAGPVFGAMKLTLNALPIPDQGTRTGPPVGLVLFPLLGGQLQTSISLAEGITITLKGSYATAPVLSEIRPQGVNFKVPPGSAGIIDADATLSVHAANSPWMLLGSPDSARLELSQLHLSLSAKGTITDPNFTLEFGLDKAAIVIDFGESDSFLQSVAGTAAQRIELGIALAWSNKTGFHISGQTNFEMTIPVHESILDSLLIDTVFIKPTTDASGSIGLDTAISASAVLGPIAASVDRVGLTTTFKPVSDGSGNLGMLDLVFGFKFPDGIGISIDAGAVAGGGFILFDESKGQYAGFLDICIAEIIQVKFIAILDTKLPDGSKGYSFLFIIFMELPPIQLSFGFTLNGVGGIAGVNRTMSIDALQTGIHAHTLDYLINPPRTVADAPKVITTITGFFPAAQGRYVFGPILELGWETFIQLTVGVVLEVPDPVRLVLLGIIDAGLPEIDEALIKIHIDILGILDFGKKKFSLDGSMYDSYVLEFPMQGDLALRVSWGDTPNFLFSLGGFNPHFNTTGLDVPQLRRLSITIGDGDNPRISASAYMALTSNTAQFGASVEAWAKAGGFAAHGYLGFDVLFIFSPFSFEIDFVAGFDVSYKGFSFAGVNLTGVLTGTNPWHLHGEASVHILFADVSKSVDFTWGDPTPPALPQRAVLDDLVPALQDPRNWSSILPEGMTQGGTLSVPKADQKTILVHPVGRLTLREKVVPLDLSISRYNNATPSDGSYFALGAVQINGAPTTKDTFPDFFAAGQFIDLSDADKLSRSSYEPYDAGLNIASSNTCAGGEAVQTMTYKEFYIDDPVAPIRGLGSYTMPAGVQLPLSRQSAAWQSALKNTGFNKYKSGPSTPAVTTGSPTYVVTSTDDLSVRNDIAGSKGTYYQVRAAFEAHLSNHPDDGGRIQIMPLHEARP